MPDKFMMRLVASSLVACACFSGCAYFGDRGRDLADVVTVSVEDHKYGCSALVILPLGLEYANGHGYGLRDGYAGAYQYSENVLTFGYAALWYARFQPDMDTRGKSYSSTSSPHPNPPVDKPFLYCGTVGASIGLYYGIRVGVNWLELTDFLLGWTTCDVLLDDEPSGALAPGKAETPPLDQSSGKTDSNAIR
jgi:hypothetical protein